MLVYSFTERPGSLKANLRESRNHETSCESYRRVAVHELVFMTGSQPFQSNKRNVELESRHQIFDMPHVMNKIK